MPNVATEKAIGNALASVEMEGFIISDDCMIGAKNFSTKK